MSVSNDVLEAASDSVPEPEKPKFSPFQIAILALCEQKYWETGMVPTQAYAAKLLGTTEEKVVAVWNEQMEGALKSRGIEYKEMTHLLSPKQLDVANRVLNTHDKKSLRQKLQEAKVSSQQYSAWLRQPAFHEYLATRATHTLKTSLVSADLKLTELVEGGDLGAIKFINELTGRYNPKITVDVNVNQVLTQVVEIISRYVEPAVLTRIADEIDAVMSGKPLGQELAPAAIEAVVLSERLTI